MMHRLRHIFGRVSASLSIQKILFNVSWKLADTAVRMVVGLVVGVWQARYLGPEQYGLLSYAGAFVALFSALGSMGLDAIVVRDMVKKPEATSNLLGTAFVLRVLGSGLALALSVTSVIFVRPNDPEVMVYVLISAGCLVFQSVEAIDLYFQAHVVSKYTVWAKGIAFGISTLLRVVFILTNQGTMAFALVALVDAFFCAVFMIFFYRRGGGVLSRWYASLSCSLGLLRESWPLLFGTVASLINTRIGQVLIGSLLDDRAVGNYSAAARISELWLVLPGVIGASVYPSIVEAKKRGEAVYRKRLYQVFWAMAAFSIPVAALVSVSSGLIASTLYGERFSDTAPILAIHIWSGVPYFLTFVFAQVFMIEGITSLVVVSSLVGPLASFVLCYLLIPPLGVFGAAWAMLATSIVVALWGTLLLTVRTGIPFQTLQWGRYRRRATDSLAGDDSQ
uniref:SpaT n=1 Tax=Spirochaeta aurantia TaxID=147 RepID=Q0PHY6_SPIAU|nr:SpaT [Spirochaeta aurantia]